MRRAVRTLENDIVLENSEPEGTDPKTNFSKTDTSITLHNANFLHTNMVLGARCFQLDQRKPTSSDITFSRLNSQSHRRNTEIFCNPFFRCIYLKDRVTQKQKCVGAGGGRRERSIFHPLLHSLAGNTRGWTRRKPEARTFTQVSHVGEAALTLGWNSLLLSHGSEVEKSKHKAVFIWTSGVTGGNLT